MEPSLSDPKCSQSGDGPVIPPPTGYQEIPLVGTRGCVDEVWGRLRPVLVGCAVLVPFFHFV